jgi:tetratricopeptide (TPR) repeat protein
VGAGVAVAIVAWPRARMAGPCDPLQARLAQAWGPARRAAIEKALPAERAASVVNAFDARAHEWGDVYAQTCKAPVSSPAELALRADCLDRYLDDLGSVAGLFEHPEKQVLDRAQDIVGGIDPVSRCADAKMVRLRTPLPSDAATRARIDDVQHRTALARAYADAGLIPKGLPIATQVATEAKEIGYKPLEGAALNVLARLQYSSGDLAAGDVSEKAAILAADLGGDPPTRINALLNMSSVAARRHENAAARQYLDEAVALAEPFADFPMRWRVQAHRASFDVKWADRQRDQLVLLELAEKEFGPQSDKVAGITSDLFWAYYMPGRYAEALAYIERSVKLTIANVGESHLRTATAMNLQACALIAVGRFDEGTAVEEHSEAIFAERAKIGGDMGHAVRPMIWYIQINMIRGRLDVALATWAKVLTLVQKDAHPGATETDVLGEMAWLYLQEGRVDDAAAALDRATKIDLTKSQLPKTMPSLRLAQGGLALAQGRPADAATAYEKALKELDEWAQELEPGVLAQIQGAEAHFGLARALAGTSAEQSSQHAQTARAAYAALAPLGLEMATSSSKRLDEWLATTVGR